MTLKIILGILLFIALLLLIPIRIEIDFTSDKGYIYLKYLFFKYKVLPKPEKKKKKKKKVSKKEEKKKEPKKGISIKEIIKKQGLSGFIDIVKEVAKLAVGELKVLFNHMVISNLYVNIKVVGSDAAKAAMNYGYCCTAVYPALAIIIENTKCKKNTIIIKPDFDEEAKGKVQCLVKARVALYWVVKIAISTLTKSSKLYLKIQGKQEEV